MKRYFIFIVALGMVACQNETQNREKAKILKTTDTTETKKELLPAELAEDSLKLNKSEDEADTMQIVAPIENFIDQHKVFKKIKFPILMVTARGCEGSITYRYTKPDDMAAVHFIEKHSEYPDCPGSDNIQYTKGIYFSKIPKKFGVCMTNFIIRIMQKQVPNYLELYNEYFDDTLKIRKKIINVKYPMLVLDDEGNGGNTSLSYDSRRNRVFIGGCVHSHSIAFDPHSCGSGVHLAKLPNTLPDSIIKSIIDQVKSFHRFKYYEEMYIEKYIAFPFQKSIKDTVLCDSL